MDATMVWVVSALIGGILVLAGTVIAHVRRKQNIGTDYRSLFINGIVWFPAGIARAALTHS